MEIKLTTLEQVEQFISKANELLGYPDNTGTLTYCNVPELTEVKDEDGNVIDSYYIIPITSELNEALINLGVNKMMTDD
jgi:hypothetical protein